MISHQWNQIRNAGPVVRHPEDPLEYWVRSVELVIKRLRWLVFLFTQW